ncbi:sushi, von Willebrand factor type A, EGF and pentraxin domain-containing protein 1-like [Xyrauchen texanus]|uniref:sushi, von Willebrand factor type A, EGF and pentraxin domain-containing protein 1-like n=1 Tax=Xyrauchen texanus TaxID=154827 RepID=UPI002241B152|nr:sushi, von Willebrand factor type A, EGF and pentraxin domain-containing protein 1-like [Xyrauchen texanus]
MRNWAGGTSVSGVPLGSRTGVTPDCVEAEDSPQMQLDDGRSKSVFNKGQDVDFKCDPGYTLTAGMVKCPAIFVANGQVSTQAVVFNTVVQITCAPGLKLNGGQKLRCGADGSLMPNVPTCKPVTCPDIYVANGEVAPQAVVFNTVVQITCSPGFSLNGAQQLRCGADGSWTSNVPTCEPVFQSPESVTCSAPVVENGVVKGGAKPSYEPNDTVIIKAGCHCVEPEDSPQMQLDDGRSKSVFKKGQDVEFKCDPGYTLAKGIVKCPAISVANGQVSTQAVVFNTVVQITCAPGFKLNGGQKLRCGADGSWIPNVPTCKPVKCPSIVITNGRVSPQAVLFNAVVQITCAPGFKLNGAQQVRCGADGFWTPNIPTCEPVKCPVVVVANGVAAPQAVSFKAVVQIFCDRGFVLNGAQLIRCGADGSWTPNIPTCEPVTCPDIYVANGEVAPQAVVFNNVVQITCSPGFSLNGAQQLRCGADGSWMSNVPTCEPVTCPDIYVANGEVAPQAVVFNTVVQITCSPGFNLNGAQQLCCGADGSWMPNVPTCETVTCPDIYVANGQVAPQAVVFNTVVQITCSPGFNLNGAQQLRCGADGSWMPNVPTCEPVFQSPESVNCSAPVVENGVIKGGAKPSYEPNDTVIIICKAGCHMIECQKECGEPLVYPEMQLVGCYGTKSGFNNGQVVNYKCAPGYTPTGGSPISHCMEGHWSPLKMKCLVVKCPAISVANGQVSPQAVVFNTVVQITCAPGFKLNGAQQVRCGADGSWMPKVPTCVPVFESRIRDLFSTRG